MTNSGSGPRRSGQTRSDVTRARILDAALRVLVQRGYAHTSTLAIQAEAGVSRGRLLHHYPSRDTLLAAAVEHLARNRIEEMSALDDWPIDPADRIGPAIDYGWTTFHQPYFVASMELWIAARTNEHLRTALVPSERELGPVVRHTVSGLLGPELSSRPRFSELYPVLLSSMRGVATTYLIDRRNPATDPHLALWKDLTAQYLL